MNPCEWNNKLTDLLLGELSGEEMAAMQRHIAGCDECRNAAATLRETIDLIGYALKMTETEAISVPRLDDARRAMLLDVRPDPVSAEKRTNWFFRIHPALKFAAALFLVFSVVYLGSLGITGRALKSGSADTKLSCLATDSALMEELEESDSCKVTADMAADDPFAAPESSVTGEAGAVAPAAGEGGGFRPYGGRSLNGADGADADKSVFYAYTDAKPADIAPAAPARAEEVPAAASRPPAKPSSHSAIAEKSVRKDETRWMMAGAGGIVSKKQGRRNVDALPDTQEELPALMKAKESAPVREITADKLQSLEELGRQKALADAGQVSEMAEKTREATALGMLMEKTPKTDTTVGQVSAGQTFDFQVGKQRAGTPHDTPALRRSKVEAESEESFMTTSDLRGDGIGATFDKLDANGRIDADKPLQVEAGRKVAQTKDGKVEFVPLDDPSDEAVMRSEDDDSADDEKEEKKKSRELIAFNPFVLTADNSFSTFAIDVDTAGYTLTRRAILSGSLPEPESVRTEEIVNAFDYGDKAPAAATFRIYQDGAQSRFGPGLNMLRIGVKGRRLGREEQRPAMLTLLVDTSGSMAQPDRIGLARQAVTLLLDQLSADDSVQIIAYNDHARLIQEPVSATEKESVLRNFSRLQCNGSTNLEEGMHLAYSQASAAFIPGAENRVILISDGVANLGAGSAQEILDKIALYRKQGITCSVFGVGSGTYNDAMLEELANKGDGTYSFLDSEQEVKRAFVDDLAATLNTIAKDAKIQVEWNPKVVRRYRQLGYENRALTKEQFRDNTVDAGEVGSGQSVTALYELELLPDATPASQLGVVRVRYRRVDNGKIEEIETPLTAYAVMRPAHQATATFRVAASAAEFAEQLRGCPHAAGGKFSDIADYLRPAAMELTLDTRVRELLELVMAAEAMN